MIQAVLFDMDGLMFDTESAYSTVHTSMAKKRGKDFTPNLKRTLMGKSAHEVMVLLNELFGKNEKVEDLLKEQDKELIKIYKESVDKLSGLDNLIEFLNQNNIRKCIGTSSRRFLVDILLEKHNLKGEFEFIISGDVVERGKPHPDIYNKCILRLDVIPQECLVIEDSFNGVSAGVSAGCSTCVVPSEYTREEDFSLADIIATSLDDDVIKYFIVAKSTDQGDS